MMKAIIHGSPDQGIRITEIRPEYCSTYGVNMNASVATARPGPVSPIVRHR